jgi:hypothetical protein
VLMVNEQEMSFSWCDANSVFKWVNYSERSVQEVTERK